MSLIEYFLPVGSLWLYNYENFHKMHQISEIKVKNYGSIFVNGKGTLSLSKG